MLRKYSEVFRTLLVLGDVLLVSTAWWFAYFIRFKTEWLRLPAGTPDRNDYAFVGALAAFLVYAVLNHRGLYGSRRGLSRMREVKTIAATVAVVTVLLSAIPFFWRLMPLSRAVVLLFWAFATLGLVGIRLVLRTALGQLRWRGRNQRSLVIVGTGPLAGEIGARMESRPEMGLRVLGFLGPSVKGGIAGPVLGDYEDLHAIVVGYGVDQVIVAVDRSEPVNIAAVVNSLQDTTATVRIAPDITGVTALRPAIEDFDGIPMICLVESPILGWHSVTKRVFDVTVAGVGLAVLGPLMGAIAILIKVGDPSAPVLYRQTRMSLDGRPFTMLKFRTMVPDAELVTGPRWAESGDPRRTRIGSFLRKTNFDELPQLWNVLMGDMSIVGPRPERPVFVEQFRGELPGYMLRHKLKGGITGWAQVNGLRGQTSLSKRLEYDIDYARRWSLGLDVKIVALTLVRSFRDPNAY
jgi:exopolysaccharide biosynthesis polyprenyl glycosylphosphotransferase